MLARSWETERDQRLRFADMCRNNIDASLSILPLYLPPNFGTVVALLCGVNFLETDESPLMTDGQASDILRCRRIAAKFGMETGL